MLNYLWAFMIFIGVIVGAFTGNMTAVSTAFVDSAMEAVQLCITMLGVMAMWTGILKIGEHSGLLKAMSNKMSPLITFLFPSVPKQHPARDYIATNFAANILGLGWAATPAGLKAMTELKKIQIKDCRATTNRETCLATATPEMCTFLILNISSLQLIPVSIIAYRSQYGSPNPTAITAPAILATTISTIVGIVFAKIMAQKERRFK